MIVDEVKSFQADGAADGQRLDRWLSDRLPALSRNQVQTLIQKNRVTLNGSTAPKPGVALHDGDQIVVRLPPPTPLAVEAQNIPLEILYEDEALIAVDKPEGMVVYPGPGHDRDTLVNALLSRTPLAPVGAPVRPGIVHRLDRATSGVMVVAKTDAAYHELIAQFKARSLEKTYLAWVWDVVQEDKGRIELPIGRHPGNRKKMAVTPSGKPAVSEFMVLRRLEDRTLVKVNLLTGRTHQIRVHFAHIKHPVVGDLVYGRKKAAPRMMLHAWKLRLQHPLTQARLELEAPVPGAFDVLS